ncbi:uncharacterized protein RCO7_14989 [Rhynchosporium graminicola]|uniref:Uncharacterized protein n=1 Tax=Rhynchosporium graminicola TaxID=2792576 RepID=A0A1E1LE55_9HELO|nr:uncharacterized protein RCO7_14989 [Rhynchosporium commune]
MVYLSNTYPKTSISNQIENKIDRSVSISIRDSAEQRDYSAEQGFTMSSTARAMKTGYLREFATAEISTNLNGSVAQS